MDTMKHLPIFASLLTFHAIGCRGPDIGGLYEVTVHRTNAGSGECELEEGPTPVYFEVSSTYGSGEGLTNGTVQDGWRFSFCDTDIRDCGRRNRPQLSVDFEEINGSSFKSVNYFPSYSDSARACTTDLGIIAGDFHGEEISLDWREQREELLDVDSCPDGPATPPETLNAPCLLLMHLEGARLPDDADGD